MGCVPQAHAQTAAPASAATAATAAPTTTSVAQLQTIEIKGQALRESGTPYSSTAIDQAQIRDAAVSQPEQLLRNVPGVEVRGYHLGGVVNVITIRGFSGGAHGGDLGMVIDGIPLNEAMSHDDGYADLNVIVPLEIERFEVYRGPVSALYGNFNRGGLIAMESRRGGSYAEADASLASFNTADLQGAWGGKLGAGQFNGAAQLFRTGDYRPESNFKRGTLSGRWTFDVTPGGTLSVSARAHQSDWRSASYLLKTQFDSGDYYGIDPRVNNDGGNKHFTTARVDYNQALNGSLKLLTFAYGTGQTYTRFFSRPQNATTWRQREESYDRRVAGAGFSLNGRSAPAGVRLDWVAGAELYRERTDYVYFEGTRGRSRVGPADFDRRYEFDSSSAFTEMTLVVAPAFRPTLGLRHDRFTGQCTRSGSEAGDDPCDRLNPTSRTTPKVGLRSTVLPGLDLRASYAEGFALPPDTTKYAVGGTGLKPTVFKQTELGLSYKTALLRGDLARYRITSSNEVRDVSPGVFENFGQTGRQGTEAALTLTAIDDVELGLVANTVNAKVLQNADPVLVGKQVTGVPRQSLALTAAWRPAAGWGGSAEWRRVGDSAVDAANTQFYGAFTTLDLGLQYAGVMGGSGSSGSSGSSAGRYRAYAKVSNATNRHYASNAFVIRGQTLVAPEAPRSLQVGAQLSF